MKPDKKTDETAWQSGTSARHHLYGWLLGLLLAVFAVVSVLSAARAQAPGIPQPGGGDGQAAAELELPAELTPAEAQGLVARLSDEEVRALLLQQLNKVAASEAQGGEPATLGMILGMETAGGALRSRLAEILAQAPEAPSMLSLVAKRLEGSGGLPLTLLGLALVLGAGFTARFFWRRFVGKRQERIAAKNAEAGAYASLAVVGDAIIWLLLELSGVVIFYGVAITLVFAFWHGAEAARYFLSTFVTATSMTLVVLAFTQFCFPREWRVYRLLPLDDAATARLHRLMLALAVIWNFGFLTCVLLAIYGAPPLMHQFLVSLVAAVFVVVLIFGIFSLRGEVAGLIRGGAETTGGWGYLRGLLADSWHYLAGAYMLLIWVLSMGQLLLRGEEGRDRKSVV